MFCFIDQMPPGMRETLYFKDDDSRLSFLQGNYVTLTNMSEKDIERVIRYHLEPINISFQAMNPELRCKMLHNRFAGKALKNLTSQTFALDQGTKTLPAALNELNSNRFSICEKNVSDLDNPPAAFILNTDINPKGLPKLDSNGCCVIQHNPGNEIYTAQLAFSFGCEKIAIRTKKTDSWSAWKYFSAQ